ncbi:DNA repair protein RAD50 isoform X2 [Hyposmocoma kahamanoa]|uniref:DNA repair protein RAD50 isoform X2 n=1 Tax=Hyposmocoma kahamanoa TaxID=1477025 RepID=UPI000E6DA176|nr:DNA repair protein RAD50 isoform X2 [Hyposmocoma kahamanoa]
MADIRSLAVRGIRSFGPDENDEQRITFEKPLTLILGQNGCGKTTIIECIRYAITGQMPPGSRNECFVHDAKVNRSTEVLGQVKLKLKNAKDKQLEVSRSMKVTCLKQKTRFQTLDSFLSVIDETGKTKDISSRISENELKVAELTKELKPVTEKIAAVETLQRNLVQWETKRDKIKTKLEHNKQLEEDLKKNIKTLFEGTTEELQAAINNYESTSKGKQKELSESYKKITSFNKEEEKIANEKTSNEMKYNKLIFLESQNQERIDKRNKCILETAKMAEVETPETIETNEDAEKGIADLTEKVQSLRQDLQAQKKAADAEEKNYQKRVDISRIALSRHKEKISNKEMEIATARKDINKLEKQITDANEAKTRLDILETRLKAAEQEYVQAESELNRDECQQEINDDEKALEQNEQEREEISEKISKLQKQAAELKKRDLIEDQLKEKKKQHAVLLNKHSEALADLFGTVPESDFAVKVNKFEIKVRGEVDAIKKKLKTHDKELTKLETERKHVSEMLKGRKNELSKAEEKMYEACGTTPYDVKLAKLISTVENLQDEKNVINSSMIVVAKYKSKLKDNSCCPLCNRGFESETEVSDLISQLTTQAMNVPAQLEKVTEELQRVSAEKDDLLAMKSLNEKITTLKETDIPNLETRLRDVDKKITTVQETIEELKKSMAEPDRKQQTAKQIQGDMPLLDRIVAEIKATTREFESLKTQCEGLDMDMTIDEATAKQTEIKQKVTALKAKIKAAQAKLNQYDKKMRQMTDKKNKIKEELLNIQKKVQEIVNLQENKKQIEENRERFVQELEELQNEVAPLEAQLKEKENEKSNVVNKNRSAIELKNSYIQNIVNSFDKVKSIVSEIRLHKERNIQREMDKIKEANEKLMEKQKQIMVDRDALTKRIDTLKDELAKQDIYKRDLEDNYKLRKAQTEIENCAKDEAELNEKLAGVNMEMLSEKEELISKQTKIFREKSEIQGLLKELHVRLTQLKNELKKTQNKDIEKKYREKFYELYITKAIDKDIKDYGVALEKCLMEFHREKMEHINLIIREMWRKIYRGNDIDYIEIKTEGSISADSERRKYDYRVVQSKNGVEIDMRGRCSAGQKVLACLIIRLALAETFSSRFGILALDEPTTNLDCENVRSLCGALGEIVQERMKQKNFMFIVITHDREFIESLGNIDKVSHFYEVSRNDDGKSRIKKIRFS